MKKIMRKIGIICLKTIGGIVILVGLVIGTLNLLKFAIYSEYYSMESTLCTNPGLNDGFVCQGISAYEHQENGDKIFLSGYMTDNSASRVYVTDLSNNSYYVNLNNEDGTPYNGHSGGIANDGENVYIVSDDCIFPFKIDDLLKSKKGDTITLGSPIKIYDQGSFVFFDGEYLYTGEFHDGKNYITNHKYTIDENTTHHAIAVKYHISDLTKPVKIYSIRDKVQGFAINEDGKILLSTSYGLTNSKFYLYDEEAAVDSGETLYGAPVYYLKDYVKTFDGPAMSEGLDVYNGKFITMFESACNKYIFGKFFFAFDIVSLDIKWILIKYQKSYPY